jgi:hypothetical protein
VLAALAFFHPDSWFSPPLFSTVSDMLWAYATLGLEPGIEMRAQLRSLIISRAHLLTRDEAEDVLWASERMGIDAKDGERVRARLGSLGSPTVIGPLVTHAG